MAALDARFQESAGPRLFAFGARALYVGPALGLSPHRNAVAVLAIGLESAFELAEHPGQPGSAYRACRSALIPPDTLHHLRAAGPMAFLYVDAFGRDLATLRLRATERGPQADIDLSDEAEWIAWLGRLHAGGPWAEVRPALTQRLGALAHKDGRIRKALDLLHADPGARVPLPVLANEAGLSASRFRHLFREATGVTVRRYRLWVAMGAAVRTMAKGGSLTAAALDAGFSSSAHFSATFRQMFGMEPSRLVKERMRLEA